jgi:hypothetical protein
MTILVINPGSGPVEEASLDCAAENIKVYAEDIAKHHDLVVKDIFRQEEEDDRGRFAFAIDVEKGALKRRLLVDMPGLPVEKVRYVGRPEQDIWEFPRLVIDGSTWVWEFAVKVARVERDDGQSAPNTRCEEQIQIHDQNYRCERDNLHNGKCQARAVLAGYTEKELGPNIWTFVKWVAARNILT